MRFAIRIANTNIRIQSVYSGIFDFCKDYIINDITEPDFEIRIDYEAINDEYNRLQEVGEEIYSFRAVETLLIHRRVSESMIERDTLLMHGAVIAVGHNSYMFTGRSGTGKTTHILKWLENVQGSFVLNGDKPFILIDNKNIFACGSPWCGKEHFGENTIIPLNSIVFMERSTKNRIEPLSFKSALPMLLEQTYKPLDVVKMKKTLDLLLKLRDGVTFFKFYFDNYQEDAFHTSFDILTGQDIIKNV